MEAVSNFLTAIVGPEVVPVLVLFLIFLVVFFFVNWFVKRGIAFSLRPISGYAVLKGLLGRSAEAGQPVHLSLGITGIGDRFTADTTAALYVLEYLAERGAISASPPIVTCAHPTALPVAQDLMRRAYRRQSYPEEFDPARVRMIAPDPHLYLGGQNDAFAYAAGTMHIIDHQNLVANVLIGNFGSEFLLLGETGARNNLSQVGGTSVTQVLPFVYATMNHPLIGEEIYAGGAYLSDKPSHRSSLFAQDVFRWLIVIGVIVAILLRTLGVIPS